MALSFYKIRNGFGPDRAQSSAFLIANNWDDYSFKTLFELVVFDANGAKYELGNVKIGYANQVHGWTADALPDDAFPGLGEGYFSLGQDVEYYQTIETLTDELKFNLLNGLKDVVHEPTYLQLAQAQTVYADSLTRSVSTEAVFTQFKRVLSGDAALTRYHFCYSKPPAEKYSGVTLEFQVEPDFKPSTNIHVLIGRNGIGKTTTLNNMVDALVTKDYEQSGAFFLFNPTTQAWDQLDPDSYFSGVVSVSFSAFDPFVPPRENGEDQGGLSYAYIGLKDISYRADGSIEGVAHKDIPSFANDFALSLNNCLALRAKKNRWVRAITDLESDENFQAMHLLRLSDMDNFEAIQNESQRLFGKLLSSGHAIVLLTITKLVEKIDEKTLVIMDEPESHLHPPLLSAFTRALSRLLMNRNGVAIIATHSPVILQEVPASCVSKVTRNRLQLRVDRPEIETFGENVGVLTREVFRLEVFRSGFYSELKKAVDDGGTYESILADYNQHIGFEGKAVLRSLLAERDQGDEG